MHLYEKGLYQHIKSKKLNFYEDELLNWINERRKTLSVKSYNDIDFDSTFRRACSSRWLP